MVTTINPGNSMNLQSPYFTVPQAAKIGAIKEAIA